MAKIPAPAGNPDAPLKALIFDSIYDSYKGCHCFLPNGRWKKSAKAQPSV